MHGTTMKINFPFTLLSTKHIKTRITAMEFLDKIYFRTVGIL